MNNMAKNFVRAASVRAILPFVLLFGFATSAGADASRWANFEPVRAVLGEAEPQPRGINIELPLITEDGSSIPLTVTVNSPMSEQDYVESLHIFAVDNPNPQTAVFRFTPLAGEARVVTRIRLNESQTVVALAKTSSGEYYIGARDIRVTIAGCLIRDDTYASDNLMQARVRAPRQLAADTVGEILTLINHPMETGLREDAHGNLVPRRLIHTFRADLDGKPILEAQFNTSVAANPYLRFHVRPTESGTLNLEWTDDEGATTREAVALNVR